jgi:hypothetical protein
VRELIRVPISEPSKHGHPNDFEVQDQGPILNIVEVVLDSLIDGGISPPSMHLCPPGDTRWDLVSEHVSRNPSPELLDEYRTLRSRSHDRHIPFQNIQKLRQLVETR